MKRIWHCALPALLLASCGNDANLTPMQLAEKSYQALIDGKYSDYVEMELGSDTLTSAQLDERADLLNEYMAIEQRLRGGLKQATALRDTVVEDSLCYVFMQMTWGNNTTEEVMIPMVQRGGRWYIR